MQVCRYCLEPLPSLYEHRQLCFACEAEARRTYFQDQDQEEDDEEPMNTDDQDDSSARAEEAQRMTELSDWILNLTNSEKNWLLGWLSGSVLTNPEVCQEIDRARQSVPHRQSQPITQDGSPVPVRSTAEPVRRTYGR